MPVYSYRGQEPGPLPERIRLSNGLTRTDSTTFTEEEIADAGYVLAEEKPSITRFQKVSWNQTGWIVESLTNEELERLKNEEWLKVREKRNFKLQSTDWMIVKNLESGKPVPQEIIEYRQKLRDITLQEDPFNLDWPTIVSNIESPVN